MADAANTTTPAPLWEIPGPQQLYNNLGWTIVVAWLYIAGALLFNIVMSTRLIMHVLRHYPSLQWIPNIMVILSFPITATMNAAGVFDPRFMPIFDIIRDQFVALHLSLMGLVLISACDGTENLITTIRTIWDSWKPATPAASQSEPVSFVERVKVKYWWLVAPQNNPRVYVITYIACTLQYPIIMSCINLYQLTILVGPLLQDPDHFLWTGIPPQLNAVAVMSFWLCFIGRNNLYQLPLPMLQWGDVMKDRERTLFLLLDFNWLQGVASQWFPLVGLQLPGMNQWTTYAVLLHGLVVLELVIGVMRLDRFWREPVHAGLELPPISDRVASRKARLERELRPTARPSSDVSHEESNNVSPSQTKETVDEQVTRRNVAGRRNPTRTSL